MNSELYYRVFVKKNFSYFQVFDLSILKKLLFLLGLKIKIHKSKNK